VILKAKDRQLEECPTSDAPWSINAYVWAFAARTALFAIERLDDEGPEFAKLTSITFDGLTDYVSVLRVAQNWVQMMIGAMKIKQNPSALEIVNVVAVFEDGTIEKYPPWAPATSVRSGLATAVGKEGAKPRVTFELATVLFAYQSGNPLVRAVLRYFARNPDWFDLYSIMQLVRLDLNRTGGKKAGDEWITARNWAEKGDLDAFNRTAQYHRHPLVQLSEKPMDLIDARILVGRIVEQWIIEVSNRARPRMSEGASG
jgi:hypothetical protein